MTRRALVIGSPTHGLEGVGNDVACMEDVFGAYGFDVYRCCDDAATRDGILDAYESLIRRCGDGDTAVVYYSGHGGMAVEPGRASQRRHRFLVPVDIDRSTEGDFRGILDRELSALQARLTLRTRNVTVILDCCHAARLSRDTDLMPRALERSWSVGVAAHLRRLRRQDPGPTVDIESNPHAVRLVAAGPNRSAYEHTNEDGARVGIFTEGLYWLLEEARGQAISWDPLVRRLRESVMALAPGQRCEVEGPRQRLVFGVEEVDRTGVLYFFLDGDRPCLHGGRILGVTEGDVYAIMPPAAAAADDQRRLATATVVKVDTAVSRLALELADDLKDIPIGSPAFPVSRSFRRRPVGVIAAGQARSELLSGLRRSSYLQPVEGVQKGLLASVVVADGVIELRDWAGDPLLFPAAFGPQALAAAIANLETLARAAALRELEGAAGAYALGKSLEVELGSVGDRGPKPLPPSGGSLIPGERIYLKVWNCGSEPTYISVFDVGVDGAIALLTTSEPSGIELFPGDEYLLGYRGSLGLVGLRPSWPQEMPPVAPRTESLVVLAADRELDLRALEAHGLRSLGPRLPSDIGTSRDSDDEAAEATAPRYEVRHLDFQLLPPVETAETTE